MNLFHEFLPNVVLFLKEKFYFNILKNEKIINLRLKSLKIHL